MLPPFRSGSPAWGFPLATWVIRAAYPSRPPHRVPMPTSIGPRWIGLDGSPQKSNTTGPISGRKVIEEITSMPGNMTSPRPMKSASLCLGFTILISAPSGGASDLDSVPSLMSPSCFRKV